MGEAPGTERSVFGVRGTQYLSLDGVGLKGSGTFRVAFVVYAENMSIAIVDATRFMG